MPNFDGTGPEGKGPKTGMQRGKCEGAQPKQGRMGRNAQETRGRGRGLGKGFRNRR